MSNKRNKYKAKILKQQEIRKVTANENTCVTIPSVEEDTMKKFAFKLPQHLSYWNDNLNIKSFERWCGDWTKPFKQETREHVIKNNYKSILDVGAGLYSEYYGYKESGYDIKYEATEITPKYVRYGKERKINVTLCSVEEMPYSDNSFDCCSCFDVLNHQLEYEKPIKEILRVTKKEAIISFFKPFEEDVEEGTFNRGEIVKTKHGFFIKKVMIEDKNVCLYSFFNKEKMKKFLDGLNVDYKFKTASDKKVMLHLKKK